jgi:hypothetical protein
MNDITKRFFDAVDAANLTSYRIAQDIPSISTARISNARTGKNEIGIEVVSAVCSRYPQINAAYIMTGIGSPILDDDAEIFTPPRQRVGIPLVSQYAYAGYLTGYADPEYIDALPYIDFTPDREMTGNWLAFEVKGDSMDDGTKDGYESGEILVCREVEPHLWRDSKLHINRRDFVIIHDEGILIKRIIGHDVEHHIITIHSLNPTYKDRDIDLSNVRQIFSVVESRRQRAR